MMDSMTKIVQFLSKEDMPRRLITMKTRIWGCYRKRVLFHINEMCKHAMNPAFYGYGHMSIDEEMYCADNILVAHYNMNQVVIYLTSTIGNVHNISIKSAQFNSSDTVAMGVAANLGAKHEKNATGRVMEITCVPSQHLSISEHHQATTVMFGLSLCG